MIESFAIHTAVLVGLVVTWFWTERIGGVFAGFAVPGYLGAIAMVAPASAATLVLEAILTYALVWVAGEFLPRFGVWSRVFGRERFLLFVGASVPVRLLVEGLASDGLALILGPFLPSGAGDGFFSVGLVLVPLLANTFWKPGLLRGLGQIGGTTLVTVGMLTLVVMPLLGLEFSSFFLSFEDIARAFLAVPKVYILLLSTAVVATWTAERYGWNAGGLLAPALLGLLVLEPTKLLSTVAEIVVLFALYRVITSLPYIRNVELSGSRRLVAMYAMAWVLKLSFAWVGLQLELPVATWDLYGFGYLLSSLVAVRCLDLRPVGRVLFPLGLNLGAGAGVGLTASTVLALLFPSTARSPAVQPSDEPVAVAGSLILAAGEVREDSTTLASPVVLVRALGSLDAGRVGTTFEGVRVEPVRGLAGQECAHLRPERPDVPGTQVWWCGGPGPLLVLPSVRSEPDQAWLGAWLLESGTAAGVVMAEVDGEASELRLAELVEQVTERAANRPVLVLSAAEGAATSVVSRGQTGPALRLAGSDQPIPVAFEDEAVRGQPFWERLRPGDGVLRVNVDEVEATFEPAPTVELWPHRDSDRKAEAVDSRAGFLAHLAVARGRSAERGAPIPPGLAFAAARVGVEAYTVTEPIPGWVLVEDELHRGFGGLWLGPGSATDQVVVAPRAGDEPGARRVALGLGEDLDARAVWWELRRSRGLEDRLGPDLAPNDAATRVLHQVMRPVDGVVAKVTSVRRLTIAVPDPPAAVLAEAGEALADAPAPQAALREALTERYPGWRRADGRVLEPAAVAAIQPLRYAEALSEGVAATVWLREDVLAEVEGTEDRVRLERWYGLQGIERREGTIEDLGAKLDDPVQDEVTLAELHEHLQAPTTASVAALGKMGRPVVLLGDLRVGIALLRRDTVCVAFAGAIRDQAPGCWKRR
ncbi:MAG: poly-gamma-glutamate biosynthesis protein PgsC/CapC [Myxococcota bacterium]